jgi:hypothetical protein
MVHDALRYEDSAFTRDLIDYHKFPPPPPSAALISFGPSALRKPGDMMQKKANPALHHRTWVGSLSEGTALPEDRDFVTTQGRSYPAPPAAGLTV